MFLDEERQHDKSGTLLACKRAAVLELAAKRFRSDFDSRLPGKAQRLSFVFILEQLRDFPRDSGGGWLR
jgi:hypothetical protein